MGNIFKAALSAVVSLIFPIREDEQRMRDMTAEEFARCAKPLLIGREREGFIVPFEYKDPLTRSAIWELKFRKSAKAADILADALYDRLVAELADMRTFDNFADPLLVPIPIGRKSMRERGFNQCDLLGRALEEIDKGENFSYSPDILLKARETSDQVGKTREERIKNLKGSLEVKDEERVKERNIIVLDDIMTTGATLEEAKRALREAGARKVTCVAVAH